MKILQRTDSADHADLALEDFESEEVMTVTDAIKWSAFSLSIPLLIGCIVRCVALTRDGLLPMILFNESRAMLFISGLMRSFLFFEFDLFHDQFWPTSGQFWLFYILLIGLMRARRPPVSEPFDLHHLLCFKRFIFVFIPIQIALAAVAFAFVEHALWRMISIATLSISFFCSIVWQLWMLEKVRFTSMSLCSALREAFVIFLTRPDSLLFHRFDNDDTFRQSRMHI